MNFQRETWLLLLLVLPALLPVFLYGLRMREKVLAVFYRRSREIRRVWPATLALGLGLLGLILALARPGWNPRQEPLVRETRDVVFVLDVSRSMLARDRVPNRLENAKATIISCLDELGEEQRVGLVVFAGTTSIKCPLTTDHHFFRKALEEVGSRSVSHGGTLIGDALLKTAEKLLTEEMRGFQDVILLTDGGDQAGTVDKAIAILNEKEASLIAIGMGNDQAGTRIPASKTEAGYLLYEGREVWSRLETETLQEMVRKSKRGLLLSAGTRAIDLAEIYRQFSMHTEKKAVMVDVVERYEEGFPWMLGFAFACLIVASRPLLFVRVLPVLAVLGVFEVGAPVQAAPVAQFNEANTLYSQGDYYGAMNAYMETATASSRRDIKQRCFYNMGNCAFSMAEQPPEEEFEDEEEYFDPTVYYREAVRYYRAALDLASGDTRAAHNLELARFRIQQSEGDENADGEQSQDPNNSSESEEGEGDPSDEGEEGEGEEGDMQESDADTSDAGDLQRATSNMTDMQRQDVPPPSLTPQDLLEEEMMNNAQREKSGRKSKPVERDW